MVQSIAAGNAWKAIFRRISARTVDSGRAWDFDRVSLFSTIDAFVQRCIDLRDICEAQQQFAPQMSLPIFAGLKGPHIHERLIDIFHQFRGLAARLRDVGYDPLDVKQLRWLDDFTQFRSGVKDLELKFCDVLSSACDGLAALTEKQSMLSCFARMAKTDVVKRALAKKTVEFCDACLAEVNMTKREFDHLRRHPFKDPVLPAFAGNARYVCERESSAT